MDLEDVCVFVQVVDINSFDLMGYVEVVQYILIQKFDFCQLLEFKIICLDVLGFLWIWNESVRVYWCFEGD